MVTLSHVGGGRDERRRLGGGSIGMSGPGGKLLPPSAYLEAAGQLGKAAGTTPVRASDITSAFRPARRRSHQFISGPDVMQGPMPRPRHPRVRPDVTGAGDLA